MWCTAEIVCLFDSLYSKCDSKPFFANVSIVYLTRELVPQLFKAHHPFLIVRLHFLSWLEKSEAESFYNLNIKWRITSHFLVVLKIPYYVYSVTIPIYYGLQF